jgi:hypothetical protein
VLSNFLQVDPSRKRRLARYAIKPTDPQITIAEGSGTGGLNRSNCANPYVDIRQGGPR